MLHLYTPCARRAYCSQSDFRILKIRESSAPALSLYHCSKNTLGVREHNLGCIHVRIGLLHFIFGKFYFVDNIKKTFLNLVKCLICHIKSQQTKYHEWIRLLTAYSLSAPEFRQNALALQFWYFSSALTLHVRNSPFMFVNMFASKCQRLHYIL